MRLVSLAKPSTCPANFYSTKLIRAIDDVSLPPGLEITPGQKSVIL
jgi:hypothetical protein